MRCITRRPGPTILMFQEVYYAAARSYSSDPVQEVYYDSDRVSGGVLRGGPAHDDGPAGGGAGAHPAAQRCGPARGRELVLHPGQGRQILLHVDHLQLQVRRLPLRYILQFIPYTGTSFLEKGLRPK